MTSSVRDKLSLAFALLRHPLQALGALLFLAALEGMFGAPSGAQRMLRYVSAVLTVALAIALVVAAWAGVEALINLAQHVRYVP